MRDGEVIQLFEAHVQDAGGDIGNAQDRLAKQIGDGLDAYTRNVQEGKRGHERMSENRGIWPIDPWTVNLETMYKIFCNPLQKSKYDIKNTRALTMICNEAVVPSQFPYVTERMLHPVAVEGWERAKAPIELLTKEVTTTERKEFYAGAAGRFKITETLPGQEFNRADLEERPFEIETHKFGLELDLTRELMMSRNANRFMTAANDIGDGVAAMFAEFLIQKTFMIACAYTLEEANHNLIFNGVPQDQYSDDHSAWAGQSNDNLYASNALAAYTDIQNALGLLTVMKTPNGQKITIPNEPPVLAVPTTLWIEAFGLVRGPGQSKQAATGAQQPFAENGVFGSPPILYTSPILDTASPSTWYFGWPAKETILQWAQKPTTESIGPEPAKQVVYRFQFYVDAGVGKIGYEYTVKSTA